MLLERFDHVSVQFADIVGSTPQSEKDLGGSDGRMAERVHSAFDAFVVSRGVEIRTVGDDAPPACATVSLDSAPRSRQLRIHARPAPPGSPARLPDETG